MTLTTIHSRRAVFAAAIIDMLAPNISVQVDKKFILLEKGEDSYFSPVTVVKQSERETPQQPIANKTVEKVREYAENQLSDGETDGIALTWIVSSGNDLFVLSAPIELVESMKKKGGIFNHTEAGGYYFNVDYFDDIKDHKDVIVALHLKMSY